MTSEDGPGGGGPGRAGAPGVTGLRRFVKRPAGSQGAPAPGTQAAAAQRPGTAAAAARAPGRLPVPLGGTGRDDPPGTERCEMCQTVLDSRHGHLVDMDKRSIACACRACYLLFTHEGAAGGRYRAVPERICHDPERPLAAADWNELQIPVTMAFFFYNSALGRVVAGYPSPGGVTECELDLEAWDRLAVTYPLLAGLAPDTEAIFVHKDEIFLIPIDMCYSLVGELRLYWQGFDGGAEARAALETFLAGLRQRAVALTPAVREGEH
ncbi:MAG TPA: DUF5947 family protein [Streptosporangiaceae bacterium]|nr:DUF5947 family protein [Streptosporangiaceae bacterium]